MTTRLDCDLSRGPKLFNRTKFTNLLKERLNLGLRRIWKTIASTRLMIRSICTQSQFSGFFPPGISTWNPNTRGINGLCSCGFTFATSASTTMTICTGVSGASTTLNQATRSSTFWSSKSQGLCLDSFCCRQGSSSITKRRSLRGDTLGACWCWSQLLKA